MKSIRQIQHDIEMERWRRENRQARIERAFVAVAGSAICLWFLALTVSLAFGIK